MNDFLTRSLEQIVASQKLRRLATRVVLNPPAAAEALRDVETFIGYPFTPTHRAFLEQHDGLTIGCFHHEHPKPQELPHYECHMFGCDGIRHRTQNLRDFFGLAYVGTIEGVTADTARRFLHRRRKRAITLANSGLSRT